MVDNLVEERWKPWPLIVLAIGILVIGWFGWQALRTPSRCREIASAGFSASVSESNPSVRPSDSRWYNEHCWEGQAR